MTEPNFSINFTAMMLATNGCNVGHLLVYDTAQGLWLISTTANRAAADARTQAVALTEYGGSAVGKVSYQAAGTLAAEVSGLAAAATVNLVRASAIGECERIATASVDAAVDDIIGYAEKDGRVHLCLGFPLLEILALMDSVVYTTSNAGAGEGLAKASTGVDPVDFPFKSLVAGSNISLVASDDEIEISSTGSGDGPTIINTQTGDVDNIVSTESSTPADVIVFTGAAPSISSIASPTESRKIRLMATGGPLTIRHQYAGTTAANRIICGPLAANRIVRDEESVEVVYDSNVSRWRLMRGVDAEEVIYTAQTSNGNGELKGAHNVLIHGGVGSSGAASQGDIVMGPQSATTGTVCLGPSDVVAFRNGALNDNVGGLWLDSSNRATLGETSGSDNFHIGATGGGTEALMQTTVGCRIVCGGVVTSGGDGNFNLAGLLKGGGGESKPFRVGYTSIDLLGVINQTLVEAGSQYECPLHLITTGNSGQSIQVPPTQGSIYIVVVDAASSHDLVVKAPSQTGVTVAVGKTAILRGNGTDIVRVTADV